MEDSWSKKLNWLATDELARKISRRNVPADLRGETPVVESATAMARVLRRSRTSIYEQNKPLLSDIRRLYGMGSCKRCARELEFGDLPDFIEAFRLLHKGFVDEDAQEPLDKRPAGKQLRLKVVHSPPPILESLGSVELFATSQFNVGADGTLSGAVICRAANLGDVRIAVRFCKLRLLRKPDRTFADARVRPKAIDPVQNDKKVEVTLDWVGLHRRTLELRTAGGALELVNLPDELWDVLDAREGDQFEAQLTVYLRDCVLQTEGDDAKRVSEEARQEDGNSFIRPGYDRLGKALPLIQKRFEELRLSDGETDWALLHAYKVELVAVHQDGERG